jgi:hypothetical protein
MQGYLYRDNVGNAAEAKMQIRAALAGMAIASIHLRYQAPSVREMYCGRGANSWPSWRIGPWMPCTHASVRWHVRVLRQQQVKA